MVSRTFQAGISDDIMHAVTALVSIATCCKCQVFVSTAEHQISADSIMGLLMLFSTKKEQIITVSADGVDEQEVLEKITTIFDGN